MEKTAPEPSGAVGSENLEAGPLSSTLMHDFSRHAHGDHKSDAQRPDLMP